MSRVYHLTEDTVAQSRSVSCLRLPLVKEFSAVCCLAGQISSRSRDAGGGKLGRHHGEAGKASLALAFPSTKVEHFGRRLVCVRALVCVCKEVGLEW